MQSGRLQNHFRLEFCMAAVITAHFPVQLKDKGNRRVLFIVKGLHFIVTVKGFVAYFFQSAYKKGYDELKKIFSISDFPIYPAYISCSTFINTPCLSLLPTYLPGKIPTLTIPSYSTTASKQLNCLFSRLIWWNTLLELALS